MTSSTGGLTGNPLHSTPVSEYAVCVVVDDIKAWFIEDGSGMFLRHGETNGICETLAKRTRGDLDTWRIVGLGVTWGDAFKLLKSHFGSAL